MADVANVRAPAQAEEQGFMGHMFANLSRFMIIFFFINTVMKPFLTPPSSIKSSTQVLPDQIGTVADPTYKDANPLAQFMGSSSDDEKVPVFATHDSLGQLLGPHTSLFTPQATFNLQVFLANSKELDFYSNTTIPVFTQLNITYDWIGDILPHELSLNLTIPSELKLNHTSYYAHVYFTLISNTSTENDDSIQCLDSSNECFDSIRTFHVIFDLIKYKKNPKKINKKKLLETVVTKTTEDSLNDTLEVEEDVILAYWKPTLHISLVLGFPPVFARNSIPPHMLQSMHFHSNNGSLYYPIIYHDEFWTLSKQLIQINSSIEYLPLSIQYSPISLWKWSLQTQFEVQSKMNSKLASGGGSSSGGNDKDNDVFKEILTDTNPILLVITFAVSMLHMLFDMLAFKNDIQFWRKKKSMVGTSTRSLVVNSFFQTVILLYLFDNDTSNMILFSSSLGLLIEYWKLAKAFKVKINISGGIYNLLEFPSDSQVQQDEVQQEETAKYDKEATMHLLYVVLPLVAGYSVHALIHQSYKSFYSWIISSLVGFVYAFGFVLMTPQLYINYRLKSVAHMPWKAMVYKSLNTFIDDLFAFVIKMPTLHRIACFRDDIIFFIYLYQRWVYPIDLTRTNEYGQDAPDSNTPIDQVRLIEKAVEAVEEVEKKEDATASMNAIDE